MSRRTHCCLGEKMQESTTCPMAMGSTTAVMREDLGEEVWDLHVEICRRMMVVSKTVRSCLAQITCYCNFLYVSPWPMLLFWLLKDAKTLKGRA